MTAPDLFDAPLDPSDLAAAKAEIRRLHARLNDTRAALAASHDYAHTLVKALEHYKVARHENGEPVYTLPNYTALYRAACNVLNASGAQGIARSIGELQNIVDTISGKI